MTETYNDHPSDEAAMDISSVFHRECISKQDLSAPDAGEAVSELEGTVGCRRQLRDANGLHASGMHGFVSLVPESVGIRRSDTMRPTPDFTTPLFIPAATVIVAARRRTHSATKRSVSES